MFGYLLSLTLFTGVFHQEVQSCESCSLKKLPPAQSQMAWLDDDELPFSTKEDKPLPTYKKGLKTGQVFGNKDVLATCFKGVLPQKRGEERLNRRGRGAFILKKPKRQSPTIKLNPVGAKMSGSIRSVDVGKKKLVALTFDFCEQNNELAGYDGRVMDILRQHKVKSTLYMGGKWMATHPARTEQMIADPLFEMGNHGWTHGNHRVLKGKRLREQILFTQAQYELARERLEQRSCFKAVSGARLQKSLLTMRYPYGTCSREALKVTAEIGLPAVQWNVVTGDPFKGQSAKRIYYAVKSQVKPGSIVVMHANGRGWNTANALPRIIKYLKAKGYTFVTVSELMRAGKVRSANSCYEVRPGDNRRYDRMFGAGTWAGRMRSAKLRRSRKKGKLVRTSYRKKSSKRKKTGRWKKRVFGD